MKTTYTPHVERDPAPDAERSISLSHLYHVLRDYSGVIVITLLAVMLGYAILAITIYLTRPTARVTSQQFRLNFEGATEGRYPNGLKFSPVEIVSTPVLQKVYERNELSRFMTLADFGRSVFVLESNPAFDALQREYQARLADTKLTALDRDRIQKEFELKRDALAKNEFSLNFQHNKANSRVPISVVRSVVVDTLNVWADVAVNEQHVVDYRVPVLSPEVIGTRTVPDEDYVPTLLVLRAQVIKVLSNAGEVMKLPGAELVRTSDNISLEEIRLQLEEIIRFRIDPLMTYAIERNLMKDPAATLRFANNQLAYDKRLLDAQTARAEAIRQTLAIYTQPRNDRDVQPAAGKPAGTGETVMPQFSDSFLDRLVNITAHSSDAAYRKELAEKYRLIMEAIVPTTAAVAYDQSVIELLRAAGGRSASGDAAYVTTTVNSIREEVRRLVRKINEIYKIESGNLRPATQLFTMTAPPATRVERTRTIGGLALGGLLVFLVSLVVVLAGVFIHSRMREEEAEAEAVRHDEDDASPPVGAAALG